MGRARRSIPRSRVPVHRRLLLDPVAWRYWAVVVLLAVVVATGVGRALARANAAQDRWGHTRPVLVAERAIAAGDALAGRVSLAPWPAALVPPGWPTELAADAQAAAPLARGAPVTPATLARGDDAGSTQRRRLAVAVGQARLPLQRGDRVDVWATTDPSLADGELATRRVAVDAVIARADAQSVVVAVRPAEVADVAEAATIATVTLVATS